MVIITNTGKKLDIDAAVNTAYSNYTELCLYIVNSTENEVRRVLGSPLETRVLSIYDDTGELYKQYFGFTNLIMVKTSFVNFIFVVLKQSEA